MSSIRPEKKVLGARVLPTPKYQKKSHWNVHMLALKCCCANNIQVWDRITGAYTESISTGPILRHIQSAVHRTPNGGYVSTRRFSPS